MLGCTAFTIFSNSARVMTILQSEGVALPPMGLSQRPCTVMTGASGATALELSLVPSELFAGAAGRGLTAGADELDWASARPANSRQTKPLRNTLKGFPPRKMGSTRIVAQSRVGSLA